MAGLHESLTANPRWAANERDLAALREEEAGWLRPIIAANAQHEQDLADWRPKWDAAIESNEPAPPRPEPPPPVADRRDEFTARRRRLEEKRAALLVELAPTVEKAASKVEKEVLGKIRLALVEVLDPAWAELEDLLLTLRSVRGAYDARDTNAIVMDGPASRTRELTAGLPIRAVQVDIGMLFEVVRAGGSLVDPIPRPPRSEYAPHVARDEDEPLLKVERVTAAEQDDAAGMLRVGRDR